MSWVRVMVANYLAAGGKQWSDTFSRQNGGTYNNQWSAAPTAAASPTAAQGQSSLQARPLQARPLQRIKNIKSLPERFGLQLN